MPQAKWILVFLSLVNSFVVGYANSNFSDFSDKLDGNSFLTSANSLVAKYSNSNNFSSELVDSSSFTGVDPSSIQEDTLSDNEKEDGSVDNILKEYGPLTVCADRATYDSDKATLTYFDNVFVMQIHNKHILCRKVKSPKKGLVYFTRNKKDTFKQLQEKWLNHAKEICADEKECNFISGQKLTMQLDKDRKVQTLVMDTEGDNISQFYTYPTNANKDFKDSQQLTKGPLDGEGKTIIYNVVNKSLELNKKAIINQNQNKYKGNKIVYDIEHDMVNIPGSKNKRSTIVLDGIQKETKLDVGLTPIADYHKDSATSSGSTLSTASIDAENSDDPAL